jgi:hypothetical protein
MVPAYKASPIAQEQNDDTKYEVYLNNGVKYGGLFLMPQHLFERKAVAL